jgi:hypothetical protein
MEALGAGIVAAPVLPEGDWNAYCSTHEIRAESFANRTCSY